MGRVLRRLQHLARARPPGLLTRPAGPYLMPVFAIPVAICRWKNRNAMITGVMETTLMARMRLNGTVSSALKRARA